MKRLRKTGSRSQAELDSRAGIDRTYVSALERRMYAASIHRVARLAEALEVEPDVLLRRPKFQVGDADKGSNW